MVSGFGEFADTLSQLESANSIWAHMVKFADSRGFSNCSLTIASLSAKGIKSLQLRSNLPDEFCQMYKNGGLIRQDPFLLFSCRTLKPSKVTTETFSAFKGASRAHQAFLDFTAATGAKSGFGVPVRTIGDKPFGGWLFTSLESNSAFLGPSTDCATEMHMAAVLAYEKLSILDKKNTLAHFKLSNRERECLLWLGAGLRAAAIAQKLGITESAVHLYIGNAKRKLGAKTREQAVAISLCTGEIRM